jgi:hypothetical protein
MIPQDGNDGTNYRFTIERIPESSAMTLLLYGDDQKIGRLQKRIILFKEKKPYHVGQD